MGVAGPEQLRRVLAARGPRGEEGEVEACQVAGTSSDTGLGGITARTVTRFVACFCFLPK